MVSSKTILALDADVLLLIIELACIRGGLRSLSATCRWIRALSMPVLFAHISLRPSDLTPGGFILSSVRPHVRTIHFGQQCFFAPTQHEHCGPGPRHRKHDSPDTQFLLDAFRGMTRLRNIVVDTMFGNGIPFYILDAVFSAPQLSTVQCGPSICLPAEQDPSFPKRLRLSGPVAPLTTFRRALSTNQRSSRIPAEADFLYCLFKRIHSTLQVAEMPSDTAPLRAFRKNDWPSLRELVLRGGPRRSSRAFILESLTRMPNLRILKLELAQRSGTGPQLICPPGWAGGCSWPNLEALTISNPHPDDELYAHLPDSLQEFNLRCYPPHYVAADPDGQGEFMTQFGWDSSLLTSAEMLHILRRCSPSLTHLRHLNIEFEESEEDIPLLRYIASAFPALTFLQLLRYHKASQHPTTTSWADLGNALAPLAHLRLLRVHLDLDPTKPETGTPYEAVLALASPLSPTLRFVCRLVRGLSINKWAAYRVVRDPTTCKVVRVEDVARFYARIDGYSTDEESFPPRRRRYRS